MPVHPQDTDSSRPARPRANTNTFSSFSAWRRNKSDALQSSPLPPSPSPPIQVLIDDLTPPAVPSIQHARALASTLPTHSPLPRPAVLSPVLASLCSVDSPPTLQSAGYDILSAYWDNPEATTLSTSDRLILFSLFLGPSSTWNTDSWEPRFKALRAFTRFGSDIVGIELPFLGVLKGWIGGAFEGLVVGGDSLDRSERVERERSIELIANFLSSVTEKQEVVSRIPEQELAGILGFYAQLVEQGMQVPLPPSSYPYSPASSPIVESVSSPRSHRRHQSSVSLTSLASPTIPVSTPVTKHPADIATSLYLQHLSSQLKILPPSYLGSILPVLFRASAFYATPLPRLTVMSAPSAHPPTIEERITETLGQLFAGPYSTTCFLSLKKSLFPAEDFQADFRTSLGAVRTLRNQVRKGLSSRLARAYISRDAASSYTVSGAPAHVDLERELIERAWAKDEISGWDAGRLGSLLAHAVKAWVSYEPELQDDAEGESFKLGRERVLDEAAGVVKDVFQELDAREEDDAELDEEESSAVGETLCNLASYVAQLKTPTGMSYVLPLSQPSDAATPFLRSLASLLARDHTTSLEPPLSSTLLFIAGNLTDEDTAKLPIIMSQQHDLSPTSPDWLVSWESLLRNETLMSCRPATREALMEALTAAYDPVKEMPSYRRPLADLVLEFAEREWRKEEESLVVVEIGASGDAVWPILGDEVVNRQTEADEEGEKEDVNVAAYLEFLQTVAVSGSGPEEDEIDDTASIATADTQSQPSGATSSIVSPTLSRIQSDYHATGKIEKESPLPSVMSLLTSIASASGASRSHSIQPPSSEDPKTFAEEQRSRFKRRCAPVGAASALIYIFHQLALTPLCRSEKNLALAMSLFDTLLVIVKEGQAPRARLAVLQYLMRLRADRDHHLYYVDAGSDVDGLVCELAGLVGRRHDLPGDGAGIEDVCSPTSPDPRKARAKVPQERFGRRLSRGRGGGGLVNPPTSRSGSRIRIPVSPVRRVVRHPIWSFPESPPFTVCEMDSPSEMLISYDPEGPDRRPVLPVSEYLHVISFILESEVDWEILSYLLCHLPTQLSNKHLFCGPKSRDSITQILKTLCASVLNGELGSKVDVWPPGMKPRDAQGLAYHTLSVLVSYRRCFDMSLRHLLVEVFQAGLNGLPATIKCCLHALTLAAFELQSSITKSLSRILEKLSQIMSMPEMAVHILGFLSVVGSLRPLHVNFTEADFKMVFGVALQYLQYHNQNKSTPTISWALSQHVRILSFYIVYVWFLAIKLPNRPRHVKFITRQLLLANEGNQDIDEPTEVCFDWLARYTYASADPRPSHSLLNDIVMSPNGQVDGVNQSSDKTWLIGNSLVTIRSVERLGWVEVLSRRPSGFTKFLCRIENVPLTNAGEVNPDLVSVVASLFMDKDTPRAEPPVSEDQVPEEATSSDILTQTSSTDEAESLSPPDPITGYVWSGSAPSQRRKDVAVDPAFLALQLSPYPDPRHAANIRRLAPAPNLQRTIASLDRIPVIDTHKVGILYVAPGQTSEVEILRNTHGSPAYTRFLEGLGRLINLRGQVDVYAGGLNPDEDGEYAYAWWDDIGQILYHTATMMPNNASDDLSTDKKRHIGNDYVRIVWNDSGLVYRFDTLSTQFQFVNIVIEPHSVGAIAAFSNNVHENEYFKVTIQSAPGMTEFAPIGRFKLISADNLPLLIRQLSLLADWFASVFERTQGDTVQVEMKTNWHARLEAIRRLRNQAVDQDEQDDPETSGVMAQETYRDFTNIY